MIEINALNIWFPESDLHIALGKLYKNSFGNQINKQIYTLQKELQPYIDEYIHLRDQIAKDPNNVNGKQFNEKGKEEVLKLNLDVGVKKIEVKTPLPIKLSFADCFTSNDRITLEGAGIAVFDEEEKE